MGIASHFVIMLPALSVFFAAGIGERLEDHFIVAAFIDGNIFPAQTLHLLPICRAVTIIFVDPLLMTAQYFPFPDLPVSPKLFPAIRTAQYKHIRLSQLPE